VEGDDGGEGEEGEGDEDRVLAPALALAPLFLSPPAARPTATSSSSSSSSWGAVDIGDAAATLALLAAPLPAAPRGEEERVLSLAAALPADATMGGKDRGDGRLTRAFAAVAPAAEARPRGSPGGGRDHSVEDIRPILLLTDPIRAAWGESIILLTVAGLSEGEPRRYRRTVSRLEVRQ
jgi:hypothetical protein